MLKNWRFQFTLNYGYIWCYETESRENKLFKTFRISQVIDTGKSWEAEPFHEALPTDIFRISGKREIPIKLRLSTRAANLLMEEYSLSEEFILGEDSGIYLFDGWVSNFEGIGRV